MGEERWSAACRAHVTHSRVAHAADLSLSIYLKIDRERCESNNLMLWPPRLYATTIVCDVSASNWFDLSAGTCTQHLYGHKGLELFSYLNLKGPY